MKKPVVLSHKLPKSKIYTRMLSRAIEALRQTGELEQILLKYGLKDWKQSS